MWFLIKSSWKFAYAYAVQSAATKRFAPSKFRQIKEFEKSGQYQDKPSFDEVAAMILRHTKMQIEYKGEYLGIREMRKHVGWYTAGYKNSSSIRRQVNEVENYEQLERLINDCRNL